MPTNMVVGKKTIKFQLAISDELIHRRTAAAAAAANIIIIIFIICVRVQSMIAKHHIYTHTHLQYKYFFFLWVFKSKIFHFFFCMRASVFFYYLCIRDVRFQFYICDDHNMKNFIAQDERINITFIRRRRRRQLAIYGNIRKSFRFNRFTRAHKSWMTHGHYFPQTLYRDIHKYIPFSCVYMHMFIIYKYMWMMVNLSMNIVLFCVCYEHFFKLCFILIVYRGKFVRYLRPLWYRFNIPL